MFPKVMNLYHQTLLKDFYINRSPTFDNIIRHSNFSSHNTYRLKPNRIFGIYAKTRLFKANVKNNTPPLMANELNC